MERLPDAKYATSLRNVEADILGADMKKLVDVWRLSIGMLEKVGEGLGGEGGEGEDNLPPHLRMSEWKKKKISTKEKLGDLREFLGCVKMTADVAKIFHEFVPREREDEWDRLAREIE